MKLNDKDVELDDKGTLWVTTDDVEKVHRVIVVDDKSHWCLTFYTEKAVVRCKDCKWHNTTEHEKCVAYDAFWVTDPDDYCAWGERREDVVD